MDRDAGNESDAWGEVEPSMPRFSRQAIELAGQLKRRGLCWEPQAGHFVWDEDGVLPHDSPFQPRVFFILDLRHFLRYAGSLEALQQRMRWLPAWYDARRWLAAAGVRSGEVAERLTATDAVRAGRELEALYEMMLERI
jgi:hypothetical protein